MPFIAKIPAISAGVGDATWIEERPMYGGKDVATGDPIFLWTSEQQGGRGLWAHGIVLHVQGSEKKIRLEVRIDQLATVNRLSLHEIAPHRDSAADTPLAGLARKLYKHAHNKIAGLANDEANFLLKHFE